MRLRVREQLRRGTRVLRVELRRRVRGDVHDAFVAEVSLARTTQLSEDHGRHLATRVGRRLGVLGLPTTDVDALVQSLRPRLLAGGWLRDTPPIVVGRVHPQLQLLAARVVEQASKAKPRDVGEDIEPPLELAERGAL